MSARNKVIEDCIKVIPISSETHFYCEVSGIMRSLRAGNDILGLNTTDDEVAEMAWSQIAKRYTNK